MTNASGLLSKPAHFFHWGVVQISLPNLLVIVAMLIIFGLALVLPFPHGRDDSTLPADPDDRG